MSLSNGLTVGATDCEKVFGSWRATTEVRSTSNRHYMVLESVLRRAGVVTSAKRYDQDAHDGERYHEGGEEVVHTARAGSKVTKPEVLKSHRYVLEKLLSESWTALGLE